MNLNTRNITVVAMMAVLSACTSAPKGTSTPARPKLAEAPKPTYEEKTIGILPAQLASTAICPSASSRWEGIEWKRILPMANACVNAREWNRVEQIGNYLAVNAHLTPWGGYYMSLAAEARRDLPRAMWMVELASKKAPNEGIFLYQMGRLYWQMGDDQSAVKNLKAASELNPSLTEAHWVMGQIAMQKDDNREAEKFFRKALNSTPNHWPTLMSMAQLQSKAGNLQKAQEFLARAVQANPRNSRARLALTQVQDTLKKQNSQANVRKPSEARKAQ